MLYYETIYCIKTLSKFTDEYDKSGFKFTKFIQYHSFMTLSMANRCHITVF